MLTGLGFEDVYNLRGDGRLERSGVANGEIEMSTQSFFLVRPSEIFS